MSDSNSAGNTVISSKLPVDVETAHRRNNRIHYWRYLLDHAAITPNIVTKSYEGSGTASDPYRVHWIERDPRDPPAYIDGS